MPLTVITLKNSTPSLRGALSKWMQEIATGVYIGNFNSRIREYLWLRVIESVGNGEATLSYASRNEIGYKFEVYNAKREIFDCDGVPLVIFPAENERLQDLKAGFSNAAKYRKKRKVTFDTEETISDKHEFVVIDIETTGLNLMENEIIEIGALKISKEKIENFSMLISCSKKVPQFIAKLTGITDSLLCEKGVELKYALESLQRFTGGRTIVGYNLNFDVKFINHNLKRLNMAPIQNKCIDVLHILKKENMYLDSYKLEEVLSEYNIQESLEHRALSDAKQILKLANKLKDFDKYLDK